MLRADLVSPEVAVDLLDLRHQVGIKQSDLDASVPEAEGATTTDCVIRVEHADDDAGDPTIDDPLGARELWAVPRGAWLQSCEQDCASQRRIAEFGLKQGVLGVVAGR
jgi:hypothetical protein